MISTHPVAIVVGGGSGIGAASAAELAAAGYRIVGMSPSGRGAALARGLGGAGLDGSLRDPADLQAVVDLASSTYGRVDAVVNCSGHAARGDVLDLSDSDWLDGFELYLMNVIRMARIVTPHLVEAGGGSIVNISTSSPFEPNPGYPVSATIRAGLAAFTKLFADAYGPHGVRMNNVLPGLTKDDPDAVPLAWTSRIPLRRAASTAEVARVVRFLAGGESSYITGQNIRVDGGAARAV